MPDLRARRLGCLLGGAAGDALGAPVEFMPLSEIRARFGPAGISKFAEAYGKVGAITDDTQMTLFTAEGLMRAWVRALTKGIGGATVGVIHHAYLRWLLTQGMSPHHFRNEIGRDGCLLPLRALHALRAPGNTCLSALQAARGMGDPAVAQNDSKGCGGVMRVAPVGLFQLSGQDDDEMFALASDAAALTHGHPAGYLSAGFLAVVIASIMRGKSLPQALDAASLSLQRRPGHRDVTDAVARARDLAAAGRPTPEQIETLGGAWVGEEALAIAVCCALVAHDFADGVRLAVNHSGDSDSTGAIAGNILGGLFGVEAIPHHWLAQLELRDEIAHLAEDMHAAATGSMDPDAAWDRYPGW